MIIAYSKLGRSWNLDARKASTVGGDLDVIRLLMRLAWDHPEHTFLLIGRNSGEDPQSIGYPPNVVNPWTRWRMPTLSYEEIKQSGKTYVDGIVRAFQEQAAKPFFDDGRTPLHIDGHIMWLGQHGGSNSVLPQIGGDWQNGPFTTPQMAFVNYCAYLLNYVRDTGVEPVLLCPDPRNYLKSREMPPLTTPVLAQYDMQRVTKFEQYDQWRTLSDGRTVPAWPKFLPGRREQSVWVCDLPYEYAGVEMTALDEPAQIACAEDPGHVTVGVISNENRKEVGRLARLPLVKEWLFASYPDAPLYGQWSAASEEELGRGAIPSVPTSAMYEVLRSFRCTITFPASGSGWATAKPWEAFAAGTVMFFHPEYDDQGHILPLPTRPHWTDHDKDLSENVRWLADFLRVSSPSQFQSRVELVRSDDVLWRSLVRAQREYFEAAFKHWRGGARMVEERLGM